MPDIWLPYPRRELIGMGRCPDCGEEFCNHGGRCYACLNRAEASR